MMRKERNEGLLLVLAEELIRQSDDHRRVRRYDPAVPVKDKIQVFGLQVLNEVLNDFAFSYLMLLVLVNATEHVNYLALFLSNNLLSCHHYHLLRLLLSRPPTLRPSKSTTTTDS